MPRSGCSRSASRSATGWASGRRTAPSGPCCSSRVRAVGAILVVVNPAYRPNELAYALSQSGARLLVTAEAFKTSNYLDMLAQVRDDLPALERVVTIGTERAGRVDDLAWDDFAGLGVVGGLDLLREREASLDCDDPINIQYTSGTTGNPKGATLTHHNILNNGRLIAEALGYTAEDRVCIPVPLYHCFGMGVGNLGCVTSGSAMVYPAPSFEPLATLEAIAEERCTSIYGVPTMFIANSSTRSSTTSTSRRFAPGSWPARRARSR